MSTILVKNSSDSARSAMIEVDISSGDTVRSYIVIASLSGSFTIYYDKWINSRRSCGKTFWKLDDVRTHYRQHGETLADLCTQQAQRLNFLRSA